MEEHAPFAAQRADLGKRLKNADFVVGGHDRHQGRLLGDGFGQFTEIDEAVLAHAQIRNAEPVPFQPTRRFEYAFVLRHAGDDVVLAVLVEVRHALERQIVRLGGPGGEDDFPRIGADDAGDSSARLLDRLLGPPPNGMGP